MLEAGRTLREAERADLLRALHTLKGNAAMLGLRPVQELVHGVEDVFRDPAAAVPVAAVRDAANALRRAVDRAGTPEQDEALAPLAALGEALAHARSTGGAGAPPAPPALADEEGAAAPEDTTAEDLREESVRVPFARLDLLLNQVNELVRAADALRGWAAAGRPALQEIGAWRSLTERLEALENTTQAVRRSASAIRLVPVGRVLARFPRLAADVARERGKQVRVTLEGGDTEIDKATADALLDPLLHLVRNAVDHGVEPPAARAAAGKDPTATIRMAAVQEGDRVRIEVEDDGRGVDRAAVLARGRELGLVPPDEAVPDEEVDELVFRAGFSTRREADAVSGRGVGLDVVRAAVQALRGHVRMESGDEGGTRFVLRVPLTVALVPVLYFEVAGETLAIPALDVEETVRIVRPGRVGPAETVDVREEAVPLVRLERVFGWTAAPDPRYVLLLRRGARAAAVGADRLLAQEAAPVRALPAALGSPRGVSGAVVDAGGRVVLLVDPAQVLEMNVDLYRGGAGGG